MIAQRTEHEWTLRDSFDLAARIPDAHIEAINRSRMHQRAWALYGDAVRTVPDVTVGCLTLSPNRSEAVYRGRVVPVTTKEMEVLLVLARATKDGHRLSIREIGIKVWHSPERQNVATYLLYLRRKLPGLVASRRTARNGWPASYWLDVSEGEAG